MFKLRRVPLLLVVLVVLGATGVVTSLHHPVNPSELPSGLSVSLDAESTALYCTGVSSASGAPGRVTFFNTSSASRSLSVSVVSDRGATYHGSIELAAHAAQSIEPGVVDKGPKGATYAVAVQISGGGVVGEEIAGTNRTEVPCSASGVTRWYATGFNTVVGSSAYLSIYNPTATAAVLNASIYTAAGFYAPASFQGISVPAHTQTEIDLGKQVVNTSNVGVGVRVLRGSLEIVGVESSAGTVSFEQGVTHTAGESWFPNVTTAQAATAQIRVANPGDLPAEVTVDVVLSPYKVSPQTLSVSPFSTGVIVVTPNPAIPAAGYANLTVHSNVPVVVALATGSGASISLSSPQVPSNAFLVRDFTGLGFDAATLTNTSSRTITLTTSSFNAAKPDVITISGGAKLAAGATEPLSSLIPSVATTHDAFLITASKPTLVVSMTLPSRPKGVNVLTPLDGR
ncbi:MAG TPA: DUF5719 family protein [Acidimicrobiales bacterium]|nr:DUF5719 family protein [Acidimicrobiales bacterium]